MSTYPYGMAMGWLFQLVGAWSGLGHQGPGQRGGTPFRGIQGYILSWCLHPGVQQDLLQ